jgi:hypothetical protein
VGSKFVSTLADKGVSEILGCFGFLDATLRPTCRPKFGQRSIFSGHKRLHGLKFEMVSLPNGMIAWLSGPFDGRRHDSFILTVSGLLPVLQQLVTHAAALNNNANFCVYADAAYPLSPILQTAYKGAQLTDDQQAYNTIMSSVRGSVEWTFGKILQYFAFLDFRKDLKILLSPVAKYYLVGALFTNFHTCLYGSVTSSYFDCDPPNLEDYLNGNP